MGDRERTAFSVEPSGERRYRLRGELDLATTATLERELAGVVDTPGDVTLDLSALTFLDSSGIRSLLVLCGRLSEGRIVLDRPTPPVLRVLELLGVERAKGPLVIRSDGGDA
jgi:anti-anti-sigma factor